MTYWQCIHNLSFANICFMIIIGIICYFALFSVGFIIFSERSLYVIGRPSVCRLSVTLVHPTRAIEIFRNISTPCGTYRSLYLGNDAS